MAYKPRLTPKQRKVLETIIQLHSIGIAVTSRRLRQNFNMTKDCKIIDKWLHDLQRYGYLRSKNVGGGYRVYEPTAVKEFAEKPIVVIENGITIHRYEKVKFCTGFGFDAQSLF